MDKSLPYRQLLFDLDGTVMNSVPGVIGSVLYAYDCLGLPQPPEAQYREFVGPPLHVSFPAHGVPEEQVWTAIGYYRERYHARGKYEAEPYPGIPALLAGLKEHGFPLYVATSKPEALSVEILTYFGLASFFNRIAGATEDKRRADEEAVLRYLLEEFSPEERAGAVLIGDTIYDVEGAAAVGLPCIAVTWGCGDPEEMAKNAVMLVDSPEELLQILTEGRDR